MSDNNLIKDTIKKGTKERIISALNSRWKNPVTKKEERDIVEIAEEMFGVK